MVCGIAVGIRCEEFGKKGDWQNEVEASDGIHDGLNSDLKMPAGGCHGRISDNAIPCWP